VASVENAINRHAALRATGADRPTNGRTRTDNDLRRLRASACLWAACARRRNCRIVLHQKLDVRLLNSARRHLGGVLSSTSATVPALPPATAADKRDPNAAGADFARRRCVVGADAEGC